MVAVPIIFLLLLRINAAIIFLSLCLGAVLVQYVAPEASSLLWMLSENINRDKEPLLALVLLLAPVIFTMVVMIRTVRGNFKLFLNVLPAVATGVVLALMATPLLPEGLRQPMLQTDVWHQLEKAQTLAVAAGAMLSMLVLWLQRPKAGGAAVEKHGK